MISPEEVEARKAHWLPALARAAHGDERLAERAWALYAARALAGDDRSTPIAILGETMATEVAIAAGLKAPGDVIKWSIGPGSIVLLTVTLTGISAAAATRVLRAYKKHLER